MLGRRNQLRPCAHCARSQKHCAPNPGLPGRRIFKLPCRGELSLHLCCMRAHGRYSTHSSAGWLCGAKSSQVPKEQQHIRKRCKTFKKYLYVYLLNRIWVSSIPKYFNNHSMIPAPPPPTHTHTHYNRLSIHPCA
jgi:hypothetical protein